MGNYSYLDSTHKLKGCAIGWNSEGTDKVHRAINMLRVQVSFFASQCSKNDSGSRRLAPAPALYARPMKTILLAALLLLPTIAHADGQHVIPDYATAQREFLMKIYRRCVP